ncbi:putative MATE family efflux protein [Paenibacillus sp. 4624]|uniref:MATE family efflux transporter n=1 Tax=Paenibacillus sp. 4624 TaxID=3156453 RepID=UPI003D23DBEB
MIESQQPSEYKLWKLSWPICIQLLMVHLILVTDSFFLSQISENYAASVGALFPLYGIFYTLFEQMGYAGCSVASQYLGAKKNEFVNVTYVISIILMFCLGLVVSLCMFFGSDVIGTWLGLSGENKNIASLYLSITGTSLILECMRATYNGILTAKGKTWVTMVGAILYNIVNIVLNYICLVGAFGIPKLGLVGIAFSTVFAQVVGLVFLVIFVHWREHVTCKLEDLKRHFKTIVRHILNIGVPSTIEPMSVQLVSVVMTYLILLFGISSMAAKTYTFNVLLLLTSWSVAIGVGTSILIARNVGAKSFDGANRQLHRSLLLSMSVNFIVVFLFYLSSNYIFGLFTNDPEILKMCKNLLLISMFWEPVRALNIIVAYSLASAGDAKFSAVVGCIVMWVLGLPLCYLFGYVFGLGLLGIWLGLFIDEVLRGLVYYLRWRVRKWEKTGVVDYDYSSNSREVTN